MLFWFPGLVPALVLLDQLLKTFVENRVVKGSEKKIFKGKMTLRKVYNKGMFLNAFQKHPEGVRIVSVLATVFLTLYSIGSAYFQKRQVMTNAGLGLMTAGAWSNTLDRCLRKCVVDYFGVETKNEKLRKITFNLGDMFLFAGAVVTVLGSLFQKRK